MDAASSHQRRFVKLIRAYSLRLVDARIAASRKALIDIAPMVRDESPLGGQSGSAISPLAGFQATRRTATWISSKEGKPIVERWVEFQKLFCAKVT